jgi:hypothetical protein
MTPHVEHAVLERVERAGLCGYRSAALAACGVPHLFTTRIGGLPAGEIAGDTLAHLARAAGVSGTAQLVRLRQVHGASVLDADSARGDTLSEADALVATRSDRLLLVVSADCVPLLVASADGRCVAAIHAGWRGLVAGVIPRTLAALGQRGAPASAAAIGPCLSSARFEVGPEVLRAFEDAGLGAAVRGGASGRRAHIDLRAAALAQLARAGVRAIDVSDRCTYEDAELWSYRRDVTHGGAPSTGRLGALIAATRAS